MPKRFHMSSTKFRKAAEKMADLSGKPGMSAFEDFPGERHWIGAEQDRRPYRQALGLEPAKTAEGGGRKLAPRSPSAPRGKSRNGLSERRRAEVMAAKGRKGHSAAEPQPKGIKNAEAAETWRGEAAIKRHLKRRARRDAKVRKDL
jgi:hypothetical protein